MAPGIINPIALLLKTWRIGSWADTVDQLENGEETNGGSEHALTLAWEQSTTL